MPLYFQNSGSFTPHIRFKAQEKSWEISTQNGMQPIQLPPVVFDLESLRTGWGLFTENEAPEWIWDPSIQEQAKMPNDGRKWQHGFGVNILLPKEYEPERLREFATTARGAREGLQILFAQYEAQKANNPGKVPVVQYQGAEGVKRGKGSTSIPALVIVQWIDRPAALDQGQAANSPPRSHAGTSGFAQPQRQSAATPVQPPAQTQAVSAPVSAPQGNNLLETDF